MPIWRKQHSWRQRRLLHADKMNVIKTYLSPTRISQPATLKGKAGRHLAGTSVKRLVRVFVAWKLLLLLIACLSPGSGYDTSTQVLFDQSRNHDTTHSWLSSTIEYVVLRLTRWDGIYFATSASRGHLYEQEWAFSWPLSRLTAIVAKGATTITTHQHKP